MKRTIIHIDEEACIGCGLCAQTCHEGAIGMVDGKAHLLHEDYCDGLGDCLPACPTGAITFEEREAPAYDAVAVAANRRRDEPLPCGCPGTQARAIERPSTVRDDRPAEAPESELRQWPVQLQLAPVKAAYFDGADLLIAADCTAYAYADSHRAFLKGRITLIGCPKLDRTDYAEKLTAILTENAIRSVTVVRMEVPCCGGIAKAVEDALQASGQSLPCQVVTITTDGRIRL